MSRFKVFIFHFFGMFRKEPQSRAKNEALLSGHGNKKEITLK